MDIRLTNPWVSNIICICIFNKNEIFLHKTLENYVVFSRDVKPSASACFLAFNLKSAILEFLCAAAMAANPIGYWGWHKMLVADPLPTEIAAAAYCNEYDWLTIHKNLTGVWAFHQVLWYKLRSQNPSDSANSDSNIRRGAAICVSTSRNVWLTDNQGPEDKWNVNKQKR